MMMWLKWPRNLQEVVARRRNCRAVARHSSDAIALMSYWRFCVSRDSGQSKMIPVVETLVGKSCSENNWTCPSPMATRVCSLPSEQTRYV